LFKHPSKKGQEMKTLSWSVAGWLCALVVLSAQHAVTAKHGKSVGKRYEAFLDRSGWNRERVKDQERIGAFRKTLAFLEAEERHNASRSHSVGLTQFADWTPSELEALFGAGEYGWTAMEAYIGGSDSVVGREGYRSDTATAVGGVGAGGGQGQRVHGTDEHTDTDTDPASTSSASSFDTALNWGSTLNPLGASVLPPVRNQGLCGACWAFTAVASAEASVRISTGIAPVHLSAQELLDCDRFYDQGCAGGNPMFAYAYLAVNGVTSDEEYPYVENLPSHTAEATSAHATAAVCERRAQHLPARAGIDYFRILPPNRESEIKRSLALGPVSVGVCGHDMSFLFYTGGLYHPPDCCSVQNHAMLLVGYGVDEATGTPFFLAQNSWGVEWGHGGFMRIAQSADGTPGVCSMGVNPSQAVGGRVFPGGAAAVQDSVQAYLSDDEDDGAAGGGWNNARRRVWSELFVYVSFHATAILYVLLVSLLLLLGLELWDYCHKHEGEGGVVVAEGGGGDDVQLGLLPQTQGSPPDRHPDSARGYGSTAGV